MTEKRIPLLETNMTDTKMTDNDADPLDGEGFLLSFDLHAHQKIIFGKIVIEIFIPIPEPSNSAPIVRWVHDWHVLHRIRLS